MALRALRRRAAPGRPLGGTEGTGDPSDGSLMLRVGVRTRADLSAAARLRRASRAKLVPCVRFARTRGCRRRAILAYFGEDAPPRCGGCDRCLRGTPATPRRAEPASMDRYLTAEHVRLQRAGPPLRRWTRSCRSPGSWTRPRTFPWETVKDDGGDGADGGAGPPRAGRHGPRRPELHPGRRGARQARRQPRDHGVRAHHARHLAAPELRNGGAEASLRAPAGVRRGAGGLRPHRAGRRLRRLGEPHPGGARGRRLPAERVEDLHHACRRGRDLHGHRGHRPRGGRAGHHQLPGVQADRGPGAGPVHRVRTQGRSSLHGRRSGGEEGRQVGLAGLRHPGAPPRGRLGARWSSASARRGRGSSTS